MAILAEPFEAKFRDRVRAFLQTSVPELAAGAGADLDNRIAQGRIDATALGCETEQELVLFMVLSLLHGRDFTEREPWASAIAHHRRAKRQSGLAVALMDASKRASAAS